MKVIATFVGRNKDFRDWLAAGMPENVVSLEGYKMKKAAKKAAIGKPFRPSIA
jgi:hypothetical protein